MILENSLDKQWKFLGAFPFKMFGIFSIVLPVMMPAVSKAPPVNTKELKNLDVKNKILQPEIMDTV